MAKKKTVWDLIDKALEGGDAHRVVALYEVSMSRALKHNDEHDCAFITAYREFKDKARKAPYTRRENVQRNATLLSALMGSGFNALTTLGRSTESKKPVKERVFFVVNVNDIPFERFVRIIRTLGRRFDRDSIVILPRGSIRGDTKAFWMDPRKDERGYFSKALIGRGIAKYMSRIGGKIFRFTDSDEGEEYDLKDLDEFEVVAIHDKPATAMSLGIRHMDGEKDWRKTTGATVNILEGRDLSKPSVEGIWYWQ